MAGQGSAPLKAASRRLLVAAFVVLVGIGAAAAFAVGFTTSFEDSLANPSSAPAVRIAALERLRDTLGDDGFLKAYRALLILGDASLTPELMRRAADASAALDAFRAAAETARDVDDAKAMAPLVAAFARAARYRTPGVEVPRFAALEQTYTALKARIAGALDVARYRRIESLSQALVIAQILAVLALAALSLTLLGMAWFIRARLLDPLRMLRRNTELAADGALPLQLWGANRSDEIGALARAIDRLRRKLAGAPDAVRRAPELFARIVDDLSRAAERLDDDLVMVHARVADARDRIEGASRAAAHASMNAVEAADLARAGAERLTAKAEGAMTRFGEVAQRLERNPTYAATLAALTADLAAFEKLTLDEGGIGGTEAAAVIASVIEAIDRLNGVVERIAAGAEPKPLRAAS